MSTSPSIKTQDTPTDVVPREELLDPLQMLLDAARFIEHDKPGWAKPARAAVARARDPAQNAPTRDEMARALWRRRRHYTPTDEQLHGSITGHDCFADVDAILSASTLPSTDRAGR